MKYADCWLLKSPRRSAALVASIGLAVLLWLGVATAASNQPRWLIEAATKAEKAGEVDKAILALRAYLEITGRQGSPDLHRVLGRLHERNNSWTEAIASYEQLLGSKPKDAATLSGRVERLKERDRVAGFRETPVAEVSWRELAVRAFKMGRKFSLKRKYDQGIRYLRAAAMLDPKLPGTYRLLGAVYMRLGRSRAGSHQLAEYLRIRPAGTLATKVRRLLKGKHILGTVRARASFPCDIWINGRFTGLKTPVKALTLPAGRHILTFVSAQYHLAKSYAIYVKVGRIDEIQFRFGILDVKLNPWARLRANKRDLGLWDQLGLPVGKYLIEATSHDEKRRGRITLTIKPGEKRALKWPDFSQAS